MGLSYDAGINFFDNAEGYALGESEKMMGRVLKKKKLGPYVVRCFIESIFRLARKKQQAQPNGFKPETHCGSLP